MLFVLSANEYLERPEGTVLNVGTIIQLTHSTSNSSKLRTRSDSNETYINDVYADWRPEAGGQ